MSPIKHRWNTAGLRRGGGRPKGALNKVTIEVRALAQRLFDEAYWARTKARIDEGKIAPAIEVRLLAYAYGEPKQTIDMPQLTDIAAALARKVVHELHPGPTTDAAHS